MIGLAKPIASAAMIALLTGCTIFRAEAPRCDAMVERGVSASDKMSTFMRDTMAQKLEVTPEGDVEINVLTLSAGGQFGAFGAGFMAGWANAEDPATRRPERFNLVTGVSAGALLAPLVFLGKEYDPVLAEAWRGLDSDDVYSSKGPIRLLLSPDSLFNVSGLEEQVETIIDGKVVEKIAAAGDEGRLLMVGAVNLNTTRFDAFDLTAVTRTGDPKLAERCIEEAVLSASAIPLLFPPRIIRLNGGDGAPEDVVFVDGGARKHVFFRDVNGPDQSKSGSTSETTSGSVAAPAIAPDLDLPSIYQTLAMVADELEETGVYNSVKVNAYMVINGDLLTVERPIKPKLIPLASRALGVVTDETLRQSIVEALEFEDKEGWTIRGVSAQDIDLSKCYEDGAPGSDDIFNACATTILYDEGYRMGRNAERNWLDADGLKKLARTFKIIRPGGT